MTAALERRYRAALDWYPRRWRDENGEAMLGTLLDEAEASGRAKPRLEDLVNLALCGLQARIVWLSLAVPDRVRDRVSAITLATGFAFALVMFIGAEWAPWAERGPWNGWIADWRPAGMEVPGFGIFASAAVGLYALWIAAFLLAVVGLPRLAAISLLLTLPTSLALLYLATRADTVRYVRLAPEVDVLAFLALLAVIASAGLATRRGQRRRGAAWLLVSAAAAVAALVGHTLFGFGEMVARNNGWAFENRLDPMQIWSSLIDPAFYLAVLAGVAVICVVRGRFEWAVAVGIAALPWAFGFMAIGIGGGGSLSAAICMLLVAMAAAVVAYVVLRERGYRVVLVRREDPAPVSTATASGPPSS